MKRIDLKELLFQLKWSFLRIWALFRNEIESLLKDRQSLLIIFLLPLAVMIPFYRPPGDDDADFSGMLSFDDSRGLGIIDLDTSEGWDGEDLSRNFSQIFEFGINTTEYDDETDENVTRWILNPYDVTYLNSTVKAFDMLDNGEIIGFIVIPMDFESKIANSEMANVTIFVDATEVESMALLTADMELGIAFFKLSHGLLRDEIYPLPRQQLPKTSPLYDAGPLIFSFLIFGAGMLLASQCIVGDEPLRRTLLTPAGKLEVITAKTAAISGIHAVQIQLILLVAMTIFRLPVYGNFFVSFFILFLCAFAGIMTGMFISVLSKTRLQANQLFLMVFIVFLLALIFITDENINMWMPMYQGVDGFTTCAYKGFSIAQKPWPFISLFTYSMVFLSATLILFYFKKSLE